MQTVHFEILKDRLWFKIEPDGGIVLHSERPHRLQCPAPCLNTRIAQLPVELRRVVALYMRTPAADTIANELFVTQQAVFCVIDGQPAYHGWLYKNQEGWLVVGRDDCRYKGEGRFLMMDCYVCPLRPRFLRDYYWKRSKREESAWLREKLKLNEIIPSKNSRRKTMWAMLLSL
jgi:hypothetical protein